MNALLAGVLLLATAPMPDDAILGTWRGTSKCVDLERAPACKDEVVVYDFRPGEKAGTFALDAKKVVDGRPVPMGVIEGFARDPKTGRFAAEFRNSRVHVVWSYDVKGAEMTGTCEEFGSKAVLRRVAAKKEPAKSLPDLLDHSIAPPQELPAPAVQPKQWRRVTIVRRVRRSGSRSRTWSGRPPGESAVSSSIWLKSQS